MEKIRAILIDDEANSLQNLEKKLAEFCPDIEVLASTQKPEEAIRLLDINKPDVIFLDIEMPRMNGFRMLENIQQFDFEIIFTTAYNHYAVDAIRCSAFDYLTKPIAIADLQNAVQRLLAKTSKKWVKERLDILKNSMDDVHRSADKIAVSSIEGIDLFEIRTIIRVESSGNYSIVHFTNRKSLTVTKLLKDFEEMLQPYRFQDTSLPPYKSYPHKKYVKGEGGQVIMENDDIVYISRRKKDEFLKMIFG